MQLTIESVEQKTSKTGPYYKAKTSQGDFTSSEDLRVYIGKTADFTTAKSKDGKYQYINKPLPEIPKEQSHNGADKEKYFVLSYAKDLVAALITSAQLKDATPSNVVTTTMQIYSGIQNALKADSSQMPEEGEIPF